MGSILSNIKYKKVLKEIKDEVPSKYRDNPNFLKYCLKLGRTDLLLEFRRTAFTKEVVDKYGKNIVDSIETIPFELQNNANILAACLENGRTELIDEFEASLFTEDIINKYEKIIIETNIPYNLSINPDVLVICLENGRTELIDKFKASLFTEDIINKYGKLIVDSIKTEVPQNLKANANILAACLENGRTELIYRFYIRAFTKEVIDKYGNLIVESIKTEVIPDFKQNPNILAACLENGRTELIYQFDYSLFTEEFINKYGKLIVDSIKTEVPQNLRANADILATCLENNRIELIYQFYGFTYTEKIINKYGKLIVDSIKTEVPQNLKTNLNVLVACLKENRTDLILQFDSKLFTKEIIDEYVSVIIDSIKTEIPKELQENSAILIECLKKGRTDLILQFDRTLYTKEIIDTYSETFVNSIEENIPYYLQTNSILLLCLKEKRTKLISQFIDRVYSPLFTEDIIEKYATIIAGSIKETIPVNLQNTNILIACLEKNRTDLISKFSSILFTEEIINKYGKIIIDSIKTEVPQKLRANANFLIECLKEKRVDLIYQFDERIFTKEIISNYKSVIIENLKTINGRNMIFFNSNILDACLEENQTDLISKFPSFLFTKEIVDKYEHIIIDVIKNKLNDTIPLNLKNNQHIFEKYIGIKRYDMIFQFDNVLSYNHFEDKEIVDIISKYLDITPDELLSKINYLYSKNNDIFSTLKIEMLSKKMSKIDIKHLERLSLHKELQEAIINFDQRKLEIFSKIINRLDTNKYDITPIVYYIIQNIDNYNELLNSIDINGLTEEQLNNLTTVLQGKNNVFEIKNSNELTDVEYSKKEQDNFDKIEELIKNSFIDLETLKAALLMKKYGLELSKAQFIYERYCHDIDSLKRSKLNEDIKNMLINMHNIYTCQSLEKLKFLYINSKRLKTGFYTIISLESSLRSEYAKMYSDTLYKIKDEHKLNEHHFENQEAYTMLCNAKYQGKKPNIYVLDGDFNMQIHALGAYRWEFERPNDFMDEWSKPRISYHGICTSYIGNNQIATAVVEHPVYGFSEFEESAILLAGNYDITSSPYNRNYAISLGTAGAFYTPEEMIKYTRHNHNEIVLERRIGRENTDGKFKRMPDYIVYFVDDINNIKNFDESNELFSETIQAAIDHDIPIVIVDRLKYAKSESERCQKIEQELKETADPTKLEEIFISYMTNIVGCKKHGSDDKSEYHKYFNKESFEEFYQNIMQIISDKKLEYAKRLELITTLENLIKREQGIKSYDHISSFNFEDKLRLLEKCKEAMKIAEQNQIKQETLTHLESSDKLSEMQKYINDYYYQEADEEEKARISEEIRNGVSSEEIVKNIESGKYKMESVVKHERK